MALDTESFELLRATVQRFILERLIPAENHLEEHDEVPLDIVQDMKDMGLFGLTVPEEFGGIGLSVSQEIFGELRIGSHGARISLGVWYQYWHWLSRHFDGRYTCSKG